jgi:uncharacterized protein YodC (DUF2158 family)
MPKGVIKIEFKCGDVVRLKSGSPSMTIEGIGKYGYIDRERARCVWFENFMIQTNKGSGRKVYDMNNGFVFKEPYGDTGIQQNEIEFFVYNNVSDNIKKYLCPVYKCLNGNYMVKVDLVTEEEFDNNIRVLNEYLYIINYLKKEFGLNNDIEHYHSWGNMNGQYVIIDYGYTEKLFKEIMWKYTRDIKYLE